MLDFLVRLDNDLLPLIDPTAIKVLFGGAVCIGTVLGIFAFVGGMIETMRSKSERNIQ
jgi:hypothetical protein